MNEPEFIELLKARRSVRAFQGKEVEKEKLERLVSAAVLAPSSMNSQPWHFILVTEQEKRKKIRELYDGSRKERGFYEQDTEFFEKASHLVVCTDGTDQGKILSCAAAIQNILLEAKALGLDSCWTVALLRSPQSKAGLVELLGIPAGIEPISIIAVGYGAEQPKEKEKKPVEEIMHWEKF